MSAFDACERLSPSASRCARFRLLSWSGGCLELAEAFEKLFGALKLRPFGNERKFDSNKINSLGIQQFGNARRFRLKTGFSGVFQQPRL
jgi:hypothetical protein